MKLAQTLVLVPVFALGVIALNSQPFVAALVFVGIVAAYYVVATLRAAWVRFRGDREARGVESRPPAGPGDAAPEYTVLVPLYREGTILPMLVERLNQVYMRQERLEILLLVGEDDEETKTAVRDYPLPPHIRAVILSPAEVEPERPALNVEHEVRGQHVVIYEGDPVMGIRSAGLKSA